MLRIGTNNVSSNVKAPTINSINVCTCQDNPMSNGEIKAFQCGATGRYLIILLEKVGEFSLCEVEVFEGNVLHHVQAIYMEYKICNDITAKQSHVSLLYLIRDQDFKAFEAAFNQIASITPA